MEVFKFPKKSYYLTQGFGVNTFSHKNKPLLVFFYYMKILT